MLQKVYLRRLPLATTDSTVSLTTQALLFAKLHSQKHAQDFGDILKSTVGIVFLGTPFRGSKSADLAQIFTRVTSLFIESDDSLINQISTGSESLRDLLYDFCLLINQIVIPLFCFFEQHPTDLASIARRKLPFSPAYRVSSLAAHKRAWLIIG